ncbi:MAG: triacylglycerol lipase [Clostridium sp.]|nr:triacylglycerol lipase [Clostridium sp.]
MEEHLNVGRFVVRVFYLAVILLLANLPSLLSMGSFGLLIPFVLLLFLFMNIVPSIANMKMQTARLRICGNGCELLVLFAISTTLTVVYSIAGFAGAFSIGTIVSNPKTWIINTVVTVIVEAIVFWNGIIRVYLTSAQLGVRWRVVGIICGWIPIAHLIVLGIIIKTVFKEVSVENSKILLNKSRRSRQICATKYPLLMVHGVFFRDFRYLNYWGRIPKELEQNGAVIYYGNHQSAASVEECGRELAERIEQIVKETGCGKLNIIAHSKGGLDSRYAISMLGAGKYVATLTTINTPHRGCEFADYLLSKIPQQQKDLMANTYNTALAKLGDPDPNFIEAVTDLTASACSKRNEVVEDVPGIYYQSVGSKLNVASGGRFPLNLSHKLVNAFDGPNDGLVGQGSVSWGERFQFLTVEGKRGISHGDMIDLNRENFDGFDVREFFVQLVADLKRRGF